MLYDPSDDGLFHDSSGHPDLSHHSSETHAHQSHLLDSSKSGGATGYALLGQADSLHHAGLADIFQLFQLSHTSQLFELFKPSHTHSLHTSAPTDPEHSVVHQHTLPYPTPSHALPLTHFKPGEPSHLIIGDPARDMATWYHQVQPDTCAVASQGFIIESLTGHHISETLLAQEAQQHGWHVPNSGTPAYHVGDLLEAHGIHVIHMEGASLADVARELQHQQKVLVGVNGEDFWYHGNSNNPLALYPGIPGQHAHHIVEVIGINDTEPDHPLVIINDPGLPDGRGLEISADIFYQAWSTSGYYMVATTEQSLVQNNDPEVADIYGGYSNADGTYHYDSDNTDRDPHTGAIVRRW